MVDSRWTLHAVLFGKKLVYAEVINLNFKMGDILFRLKWNDLFGGNIYANTRVRNICLRMTSQSRDFVYI